MHTSPIIVQGNLIQYSRFRRETASIYGPGSSDMTSEASRRRRYRGVLEANNTPNIAHFTREKPTLDTSMLHRRRFNQGHKTQNKQTRDFVQTMKYTEIENVRSK